MSSKKPEQPQSGVLSAEQLLRGAQPRVVTVELKELGGQVRLRELTRAERLGLTAEGRTVLAQVLSLTLVEPKLTDEQIDGLEAGMTQPAWLELDDAVSRVNRLGKYKDITPEEAEQEGFREPA